MKSFSWHDFLKRHPIWGSLSDQEIVQLLTEEASEEKACPQDSVILREGDSGDSLFLLGAGSTEVVLGGENDHRTSLALLGQGDFFGEIALFGRKSRSATVIARESCTLLEIKGHAFLQLAEQHPDVKSQVMSTRGERLQHLAQHRDL